MRVIILMFNNVDLPNLTYAYVRNMNLYILKIVILNIQFVKLLFLNEHLKKKLLIYFFYLNILEV